VVEVVENDGRGLNLTWEVRDGIRHHTGAVLPATLEGQIVRFADRIAYINHDIDDAVRAELITVTDLPAGPLGLLGDTDGDRIDMLVHDLVDTSYETGTVVQSPPIAQAMTALREFMFQTVYPQSLQRAGEQRVRHVITNLMQYFLEHPEAAGIGSGPDADRLDRIQAVTDYISGMTDRYALTRYRELFEPRSWAGT
jgi:dGTPase